MTQYNTTDQGPGEAQGAASADSIDLLIRHLELAQRAFSGPQGTSTEDEGEPKAFLLPDTICTFLYGASGTFCPLLYIHAS